MKLSIEQKLAIITLIVDIFGLTLSIIMTFANQQAILWIIIIILIMLNIIVVILYHITKNQLNTFKIILSKDVPLYGLLNYISKKSDEKTIEYQNQLKLTSLMLIAEVTGEIRENKNNDLKFTWVIKGTNTEKEPVSNFHIRIGADNSINDNELLLQAYDCSACTHNEKCESCCLSSSDEKERFSMIIEKKLHSKTYQMLNLQFNDQILHGHTFVSQLSYEWPQCYNAVCDFLLIDPNNFATCIDKITIKIKCDDKIIKRNSKISLNEFKKTSAKTNMLKKLNYCEGHNCFEYEFIPKKGILYYIVIIN